MVGKAAMLFFLALLLEKKYSDETSLKMRLQNVLLPAIPFSLVIREIQDQCLYGDFCCLGSLIVRKCFKGKTGFGRHKKAIQMGKPLPLQTVVFSAESDNKGD